jgi:hypothetical protein
MRQIDITEWQYINLQKILKEFQDDQMKRYGFLIDKTPEDVITHLIAYYLVHEEADEKKIEELHAAVVASERSISPVIDAEKLQRQAK